MPQRTLTPDELERLNGTPFSQMKKILEERQVPAKFLNLSADNIYRDMAFRITVERCEYDNGVPYLCITEATNNVGFLFDLDGKMTQIVNYK